MTQAATIAIIPRTRDQDTTAPTGLTGSAHSAAERFIPITKAALMDRLSEGHRWPGADVATVRRLFRYLDYWRQQQYSVRLLGLLEAYHAFNPDTDLLQTRTYSEAERDALQRRAFQGIERLLQNANYRRLDPSDVDTILTRASIYGLDLHVDLDAFEEVLIYYRGISNEVHERRSYRKFGRKEEFEVPVFRRLCVVFKMKPFEKHVAQIMAQKDYSRRRAERFVKRRRAILPKSVKDGNIYIKLFRNIPHTDMEMVFPNTEVRFRLWDKVRLGATAGGGVGFGLFTSAGKIALLASNPFAAAGAAAGVGAIAFRQAMAFVNQKQRYMVVMAQNLYFHAMADNRSAIVKISNSAAEEDIKEDWLLYAVLAKTHAARSDVGSIDKAIEDHLKREFGIAVDFDISDAMRRLKADGILSESADGTFATLPPEVAARHIDQRWDLLLDNLPDPGHAEGVELDSNL